MVDELNADDEIRLRDYWAIVARQRRLIAGITALVVVLTALLTLRQTDIYQSTATLMPLGAPRGGLATALGELGGNLAAGLGFSSKDNPTDRLMTILQSRTLALDVIQHLNLLPLLFPDDWDTLEQRWRPRRPPTLQDAVRKLSELVALSANRQGVITLLTSHPDPVLSAAITNRYIEALQRTLNDKAFSLAKKNRAFVAAQLEKTRQDLALAEETLKHFEQQYKIVALEAQTKAAVEALASLEETIRAREVQLGVHKRLMTGANREVYLIQEELRELREQLAQLQHGTPLKTLEMPTKIAQVQGNLSLDDAPEIKLHYSRLQREAIIQNKLFTLLAQQLEQAKIDEARDETAFQVVDQAVPPERKSKPKRALMILLSIPLGALGAIVLAFCRAYLDPTVRTKNHLEQQLGLTCLVTMPSAKPAAQRQMADSLPHAALADHGELPDRPDIQALRYLYTRFKHLPSATRLQTILLIGGSPDESITSLLIDLAQVAASTGERTLLVDGNRQHPALHTALGCTATPGLAEGLTAPTPWQQTIQHTTVPNLDFVAAGSNTPHTSAALASAAFDTLLTQYREHYDLILCTTAPVCAGTDAAVLGSKLDATCLLLTAGVSHFETVLEAKHALEAVQANIVGAILRDKPL